MKIVIILLTFLAGQVITSMLGAMARGAGTAVRAAGKVAVPVFTGMSIQSAIDDVSGYFIK